MSTWKRSLYLPVFLVMSLLLCYWDILFRCAYIVTPLQHADEECLVGLVLFRVTCWAHTQSFIYSVDLIQYQPPSAWIPASPFYYPLLSSVALLPPHTEFLLALPIEAPVAWASSSPLQSCLWPAFVLLPHSPLAWPCSLQPFLAAGFTTAIAPPPNFVYHGQVPASLVRLSLPFHLQVLDDAVSCWPTATFWFWLFFSLFVTQCCQCIFPQLQRQLMVGSGALLAETWRRRRNVVFTLHGGKFR